MTELRKQLAALQAQLAQNSATAAPAAETAKKIDDLREQQEIQQAEIATHEQSKVESASKYSLKLTGLLLFNGFVNTGGVDTPDTPTISSPGAGSTGASMRQTMLGFYATGPHIFGASSFADLHIDFYGNPQVSAGNYAGGYYGHPSVPRLRTAHAGLLWDDTELSFAFDRPLISPDSPSSLVSLAVPALAWSGNLWQWNPQLELSHTIPAGPNRFIKFESALIDTQDTLMPPLATSAYTQESLYTSLSEQSRWPGVEARIALTGSPAEQHGNHFGVGGYFSPHLLPNGTRYNAWAATLDEQLQLPHRFELTGSAYRALGLGGLGGGAYKDFTYVESDKGGGYYYHPLDDVGGWAQIKKRAGQRLEFNGAFGIDNVFAHELSRTPVPINYGYSYLARNHTATGNVIYSPSAYLLFSLEFRHLTTWSTTGAPSNSNVVGLGAGYSF
ncbi:hypothetical protein GRAN_4839 [Granulicella sibirica]|uniref:Uncharacterized protein n=2 Tax=Granulicella sibirica TaxID=2479048 RepID=A0A4Q0SX75_9BACT|nr:hypothetical protein GRAN_4839 [Granulicella sibirica]